MMRGIICKWFCCTFIYILDHFFLFSPAYPRNASPHPGNTNPPGAGFSNSMHNYPGRPGYQQFPVNSPYGAAPNGMKRPSGDGFGPPSKYPRPVSNASFWGWLLFVVVITILICLCYLLIYRMVTLQRTPTPPLQGVIIWCGTPTYRPTLPIIRELLDHMDRIHLGILTLATDETICFHREPAPMLVRLNHAGPINTIHAPPAH